MISKLALGTAQFGLSYGVANTAGQPSLEEVRRILDCAKMAGIGMLDTAMSYGVAHQRLGGFNMSEWNVVSKLPARSDQGHGARWVLQSIQKALAELRLSHISGLLLHQSRLLLDAEGDEIYEGLSRAKNEGLVDKIGVSVYSPSELEALIPRFKLDLVQLPFNVLDRRMFLTGWLDRLNADGTEIHARSCFLQGLLLMNDENRPSKFDKWGPIWTRWKSWLDEMQIQPLQACLAHSLSYPQISKVIVGVDSEEQLYEILAASNISVALPPNDIFSANEELINPSRWDFL